LVVGLSNEPLSLRDDNSKVVKMVKTICEIGPRNLDAVSRSVGVPKETARYWYRNWLLGSGFTIHASIDYEKIGLNCVILVMKLEEEFSKQADKVFAALREHCNVENYNTTVPFGICFAQLFVPKEQVRELIEFTKSIQGKGVFRSIRAYAAKWHRDVPMRAEYFDFSHHIWDFDWGHMKPHYDRSAEPREARKIKIDINDVKILRELQVDATRDNVWISKALGIHGKTIAHRLKNHIAKSGLILGYRLDWSHTDYESEKEAARVGKHRYSEFNIMARDLAEPEKKRVIATFSQFPFISAEAVGIDFYYARGAFPTDRLYDMFSSLKGIGEGLSDRLELHVIDSTLPFNVSGLLSTLFNNHNKRWTFDSIRLKSRFENLAKGTWPKTRS